MSLSNVAANKRHLTDSNGHPFFILGINYAGYFDRAWKMWESDLFDPDLIATDFRKAQNSGFNALRLFVHRALEQDIRQDRFDKLDQVLSLAQDHDLKVLLTLNDSHSVNLPRVSEVDVKLAERYTGVSTILGYDLQNEPVFYNLVAATYPAEYPAPVQSSVLVDTYGERVSQAQVPDLQQQRRIPGFLSADTAYYYINALYLFLEYDRAINTFVKKGKGTYVDFMLSAEAQPWYVFIEVMDKTVEAWLHARINPVRAAGCKHLLTVGWSWQHFAVLPANRVLGFQQYHNYAGLSLAGFNTNVAHLKAMQQAFPNHPITFGEFGWSNQTSSNPATSQAVSPALTALYEAATHAYLRANGFGGAFKWMLNDVDIDDNPHEANFGVFKVGDQPKPIRDVLARFSQDWPAIGQPASFIPARDLEAGMAYRFDVPRQVTVGGHLYQDRTISWQADGEAAHCFITKAGNELLVDAQGAGQLTVAPWDLIAGWDRGREADLYRVYSPDHRTRERSYPANENVVVDLGPGVQYAIAMGAELPGGGSAGEAPLSEPLPGEHVVLLGDSDGQLSAALTYIRRFAPDFTFTPREVAGRWAYVTVVASPEQVPDSDLEAMRSVGALLVERIHEATPAATKNRLDELAGRGRRFLAMATPPQEEPPTEPAPEPPPETPQETYVVQPGDTLSGIAKKLYGDFRLWPVIYEANRDQLSSPSYIRVGMTLLIPPKP